MSGYPAYQVLNRRHVAPWNSAILQTPELQLHIRGGFTIWGIIPAKTVRHMRECRRQSLSFVRPVAVNWERTDQNGSQIASRMIRGPPKTDLTRAMLCGMRN